MNSRVAWNHLRETLGHWKDGTRPGDDEITDGNVARAISDLIEAMIDEREADRAS